MFQPILHWLRLSCMNCRKMNLHDSFPHWLLLQGHDSITEMKYQLRKHTQLSAFRKPMEDCSGSIPEVRIQEFSKQDVREVSQMAICLPYKHKDSNSDPQPTLKRKRNKERARHDFMLLLPQHKERKRQADLWVILTCQSSQSVSARSSRSPVSKCKDRKEQRETFNIYVQFFSYAHT